MRRKINHLQRIQINNQFDASNETLSTIHKCKSYKIMYLFLSCSGNTIEFDSTHIHITHTHNVRQNQNNTHSFDSISNNILLAYLQYLLCIYKWMYSR